MPKKLIGYTDSVEKAKSTGDGNAKDPILLPVLGLTPVRQRPLVEAPRYNQPGYRDPPQHKVKDNVQLVTTTTTRPMVVTLPANHSQEPVLIVYQTESEDTSITTNRPVKDKLNSSILSTILRIAKSPQTETYPGRVQPITHPPIGIIGNAPMKTTENPAVHSTTEISSTADYSMTESYSTPGEFQTVTQYRNTAEPKKVVISTSTVLPVEVEVPRTPSTILQPQIHSRPGKVDHLQPYGLSKVESLPQGQFYIDETSNKTYLETNILCGSFFKIVFN